MAQAPLVQNVCNLVNKVIQVPTQVVQQVTIQVPVINGIPLPVVNGVPQLNGVPVVGSLLGKVSGTLTYITADRESDSHQAGRPDGDAERVL